MNLDYLNSLLGVEIPQKKAIDILERLGFEVKMPEKNTLETIIPTRRLDVSLAEDLIEEIGRIYGYEKVPAAFPFAALIPPRRNDSIFWENVVKSILKEAGFTEVYNYSFIGEEDVKIFGYSPKKNSEIAELENPISEVYNYLRPSLIPNLLKNIQKNQRDFNEIKIFELGKIFAGVKTVKEKKMLTGVMTGDRFYQAKGIIDLLLRSLGISNSYYDEYQPTPEESKMSIWYPKKCAEIKIDNAEIGFLGELSPRVLEVSEIPMKVVAFDLDFEKLAELASEEAEYRQISKYPAAVRDLAILVPREVLVEEVLNKIEIAGGKLIRDVDLFDIYEGEEIKEGKKNLAFHIIYQAEDHTLVSKEIDSLQQKIIKALEENPEWQVRK